MARKTIKWKTDAAAPKIAGDIYVRPTLFAKAGKFPEQPFGNKDSLNGAIGEFRGYFQRYKTNGDRWNPWGSQFGYTRSGGGKLHGGIDIYAPGGPHPARQPVYATVPGTVTAYHRSRGLGEFVTIQFRAGGEAYQVYYAHLDRIVVGNGKITEKQVEEGIILGYAGYSGNGDSKPVCKSEEFDGFDSGHVHVLIENRKRGERYDPAKVFGWTLNYVGKSNTIYCKDLKKAPPEKSPQIKVSENVTARHITIAQDTLTAKLGLPEPLSLSHGGVEEVCRIAEFYEKLNLIYEYPTSANLPKREELRAAFKMRIDAELQAEIATMDELSRSTKKQDALRWMTHTNNAVKIIIGIGALATLPFSAPAALAFSIGGLLYSVTADSAVTAMQIAQEQNISNGEALYTLTVGDGSGMLAVIGRGALEEGTTLAGRKMLNRVIGVLGSAVDVHNAASASLAFREETLDLREKMAKATQEMTDLKAFIDSEISDEDIDDAIKHLTKVNATVLGEWCAKLKAQKATSPAMLMLLEGIERRGPSISAR